MYHRQALGLHLLLKWTYGAQDASAHFWAVRFNKCSQSEREALVSRGIDHISSTKCRVNLQTCTDQKPSNVITDGESRFSITATATIDIQ